MRGLSKRFILTGGPCAGKTTALKVLKTELPKYGWNPVFVPELPTLMVESGIPIASLLEPAHSYVLFEQWYVVNQIRIEEMFSRCAEIANMPNTVLIMDRGLLDPACYIDRLVVEHTLQDLGLDWTSALQRYDAVFHLVTAADGAVEHYTLNNPARYESPAEAIKSDLKLREIYSEHGRQWIIKNTSSFMDKMKVLVYYMRKELGEEEPGF